MLPQKILSTIKKLYQIINNQDIYWVISGSVSLVIQGVDTIPHDIDIITDKKGSKILDGLLAEFRIESPRLVESEKMKSYWGVYELNGVEIDTVADFQYRLKDGSWSKINKSREIINKEYKEMVLPIFSLGQELIEYENMGRFDKTGKIKQMMIDTELLKPVHGPS